MFSRNVFLRRLVDSLYQRNDIELNRGNFRVKGDTVDIYLAYTDSILRVCFWDDEVDSIEEVDPVSGVTTGTFESYKIYPANLFMTTKENTIRALHEIEDDLHKQVEFFEKEGRMLEAKRIYERVTYDMEMIRELGHCSGIENYSRYFDGRAEGTRPYCLLDFFPKDYLIVIDESHVTVPQLRAMYGGDRARKENLVEYGFRLPAARDNRPLTFDEFEALTHQVIYVSATPGEYERERYRLNGTEDYIEFDFSIRSVYGRRLEVLAPDLPMKERLEKGHVVMTYKQNAAMPQFMEKVLKLAPATKA